MKIRYDETITTAWDRVRELGTVTYRQLDHWTRLGYVHTQHGQGSGYARTISDDELNIVAWMGHLTAQGFTPARAATLGRILAEQGWADLGALRLEMAA